MAQYVGEAKEKFNINEHFEEVPIKDVVRAIHGDHRIDMMKLITEDHGSLIAYPMAEQDVYEAKKVLEKQIAESPIMKKDWITKTLRKKINFRIMIGVDNVRPFDRWILPRQQMDEKVVIMVEPEGSRLMEIMRRQQRVPSPDTELLWGMFETSNKQTLSVVNGTQTEYDPSDATLTRDIFNYIVTNKNQLDFFAQGFIVNDDTSKSSDAPDAAIEGSTSALTSVVGNTSAAAAETSIEIAS